jgi:hypothetical protein
MYGGAAGRSMHPPDNKQFCLAETAARRSGDAHERKLLQFRSSRLISFENAGLAGSGPAKIG